MVRAWVASGEEGVFSSALTAPRHSLGTDHFIFERGESWANTKKCPHSFCRKKIKIVHSSKSKEMY